MPRHTRSDHSSSDSVPPAWLFSRSICTRTASPTVLSSTVAAGVLGSRRIIIGSLVNILQFAHSLTFFLFKVSEISPFSNSKISDFSYYQPPPQFCCWRNSPGRAVLHSFMLRQYCQHAGAPFALCSAIPIFSGFARGSFITVSPLSLFFGYRFQLTPSGRAAGSLRPAPQPRYITLYSLLT